MPSNLARLTELWPTLPERARAALVELAEALAADQIQEPPAVAVSAVDAAIVRALHTAIPHVAVDVPARHPATGRIIDRSVIAAHLLRLERAGLVHRPLGPRRGYVLTPSGERLKGIL